MACGNYVEITISASIHQKTQQDKMTRRNESPLSLVFCRFGRSRPLDQRAERLCCRFTGARAPADTCIRRSGLVWRAFSSRRPWLSGVRLGADPAAASRRPWHIDPCVLSVLLARPLLPFGIRGRRWGSRAIRRRGGAAAGGHVYRPCLVGNCGSA